MKNELKKIPWAYRWFKQYIKFMTHVVYYKDTYVLGAENIPADGTPVLIASDHQNSFSDALAILMSIWDRVVHFIVRGDVFKLHPLADKFLRSIGLLPCYRLNFDGEESLGGNEATFADAAAELLAGDTVVIFPEGGHQYKHWLGRFTYGYTTLAFQAARQGNFEKEIFILPACNHYSDYYGMRTQMLVKFGTPISLQPYYELFKTRPRTAMRQVSAVVRAQISSLMLDIRDLDNYGVIDGIRQGAYGSAYAASLGLDPANLPEKLESDKQLVAALAKAKEESPEAVNAIYSLGKEVYDELKERGLKEKDLNNPPTVFSVLGTLLALLVLLPVAVFAIWPAIPCWFIPLAFTKRVYKKIGDPMFQSTFAIILNVLFLYPIFGLITLIVTWVNANVVSAVIYVLLFPALCLFEWAYCRWIGNFVRGCRYLFAKEKAGKLNEKKEKLFAALDAVLTRK